MNTNYLYSIAIAENLDLQKSQKESIVTTALELVGSRSIHYVSSHPELGQSPEGFDCSGFVRFVLLASGFHVGDFIGMDEVRRPIRHANEFWDHYGVSVQTTPEAGDLIFFSRRGLFPTHMGIVRDEESYIHAPGTDGTKVAVENIVQKPITPAENMGRILFQKNPIGYKAPTLPHPSPSYRRHQELAS